MKVTWLDRTDPDPVLVAGAVAVGESARAADFPEYPQSSVRSFVAEFRHGWDGEPPEIAVCSDDMGRVVGTVHVWLPQRDNTHVGSVHPVVDPARRREGIGRQLLDAGIDHARRHGRTVVFADSLDRDDYVAFARAMGFEPGLAEITRRQNLLTLDWASLSRLGAEARAKAASYELIRIAGPTPDELVDDIAMLTAAINDAPRGTLDFEDEVFDAERVRAFDAACAARERRIYRIVARRRESGELGGHTVMAVHSERPWFAEQFDTSVLRSHRGNRLGLLLKIEMLRWLAESEPQVRTVMTWNAESNENMIAVNEVLGYEIISRGIEWQLKLDSR